VSAADRPTLSAIVPATDSPPTLNECLAAIAAADEPPDEVIVVAAPSRTGYVPGTGVPTSGHGRAAKPLHSGTAVPGTYLVHTWHRGPAAARNVGAAAARGDLLVFVDADVLPHLDAFARIRDAFATERELVAVIGSYDADPRAPGTVSRFRNLLHRHVHQEGAGPATTFWAGLGAIRREAFERAGGFDAARFPNASVEDVELGMRLAASGAKLRLDPLLEGTHLKAWTLAGMLRADAARRAFPWTRLLLERGGSTALNLGWRHRATAAASLAGVLAVTRRRAGATVGSALAVVLLNRRFYRELLRREGPARAAVGIGLHMLHHLAGMSGAAAAVTAHLGRRR
jgi:GT2 family glycosyltransferase